jgi:hypothetical protein
MVPRTWILPILARHWHQTCTAAGAESSLRDVRFVSESGCRILYLSFWSLVMAGGIGPSGLDLRECGSMCAISMALLPTPGTP